MSAAAHVYNDEYRAGHVVRFAAGPGSGICPTKMGK